MLERKENKLRRHILGANTESPPSQYGGAIFLMANPPFDWGSSVYVVFFAGAFVGSGVDPDGAQGCSYFGLVLGVALPRFWTSLLRASS